MPEPLILQDEETTQHQEARPTPSVCRSDRPSIDPTTRAQSDEGGIVSNDLHKKRRICFFVAGQKNNNEDRRRDLAPFHRCRCHQFQRICTGCYSLPHLHTRLCCICDTIQVWIKPFVLLRIFVVRQL